MLRSIVSLILHCASVPSGQVEGWSNSLPGVVVRIGGIPATVSFAGLASGLIGLYQFNVVVPAGVSGDMPLTMSIAGQTVIQNLWLATQ